MTQAAEPAWVGDVLGFWFSDLEPAQWFKKDAAVDAQIAERFGDVHGRLRETAVEELAATPRRALAAIIVLDQFPRNLFRDSPQAFASDAMARALADLAVVCGHDQGFGKDERTFIYLPFEHSEDFADQDRSVALISSLGDDNYTQYAEAHRDVISRFGRFPHRNAILGRQSTVEEEAYLARPGSGF